MSAMPHEYRPYPAKTLFAGSCVHCAMKWWQHEGVKNEMGTEEEVKEIFDEAMAKAKDPKEILKAIMIEGRQVPKDYWELASNVQFFVNNVPGHYLTWGNRRYERGSLEYTHESRFGPINDCYLPETDAIKDIEEELIDAMFNTMVLYWKGQSSPASGELVRAITAALDACEEMRKLAAQ